MKNARVKFVLGFLLFAFAFLFVSSGLLNQPPESFFGAETQAPWQSVVSIILSPIKIILLGPLLPFIQFLQQDPDAPPPFYLIGFAIYWTILAFALHYVFTKVRRTA